MAASRYDLDKFRCLYIKLAHYLGVELSRGLSLAAGADATNWNVTSECNHAGIERLHSPLRHSRVIAGYNSWGHGTTTWTWPFKRTVRGSSNVKSQP